jgi:hypothetical protein
MEMDEGLLGRCSAHSLVARPTRCMSGHGHRSVKLGPVCVDRRLAVLCGGESGDLERPAPLDGVWPP